MPSVVKFVTPFLDMKFYYNVTQKVGPYSSKGCVNDPLDVELVNLLLSIGYPAGEWPEKMKPAAITRGPSLDVAAAFSIYRMQDDGDEYFTGNSRPDGVVSVGNSSGAYGANTIFTIVRINGVARKKNLAAWLKLYDYPGISPGLKAKITHPYTS